MRARLKRFLSSLGSHVVLPHLTPALPDPRTSPAVKAAIISLGLELQSKARSGPGALPRLGDSGFRVFSQFEEDGYLVYLAAVLELEPKIFLEIGAADGIYSNCANLALNLGWHGLFIDGDAPSIERGRAFYAAHPDTSLYPPLFMQAFIDAGNINQLVSDAGLAGNIGVCSIDLDGNDCWIWQALEVVSPAVVIIETRTEFGLRNVAVPYDASFQHPGKHPEYFGASGTAMVSLAAKKGYRLVGANRYGFNLIFVKKDLFPDRVPEVALESLVQHPRNAAMQSLTDPIRDWEYVSL